MTVILIRRPCEDTDTLREDGHVKREAEIGVMQLQLKNAKNCQQLPKTRRGKEGFFSRFLEKSMNQPMP